MILLRSAGAYLGRHLIITYHSFACLTIGVMRLIDGFFGWQVLQVESNLDDKVYLGSKFGLFHRVRYGLGTQSYLGNIT